MSENPAQFESRKLDHLRIALDPKSQTPHLQDWDSVRLAHEALPDLNFSEIDITVTTFGRKLKTPLFISSMTAGHLQGEQLNSHLAEAASKRGWLMGVGSQRRELTDPSATQEWKSLRQKFPDVSLVGNLGIAQVLQTPTAKIQNLIDGLEASALFVHTNPLQEALQPEGTTDFAGSFKALEGLCKALPVPVILKEVGCGFSKSTLRRILDMGLYAVDVSGAGGTHWGRVEGQRVDIESITAQAALSFADWGFSTVDSLRAALALRPKYKVWASGGVRSGLDAAKAIFLGAEMVGFAKPLLEPLVQGKDKGPERLDQVMQRLEYELRIALFCTGCKTLTDLRNLQETENPV